MTPDLQISEIEKLYDKTKGRLFFQKSSGFLGSILFNMEFQWDETIDTAQTNGLILKWNPHFFAILDKDTRITVLAHELWHVAYMHCIRRGSRDPELWNIAADHVVNLMLKEHGYYMGGFPYIMNDKYKGWTTEDVYSDLLKNPPPPPPMGGIGPDIGDPGSQGAMDKAVGKVVAAATIARMTNSAGDIPGEVTFTIEKFLKPKLPWDTLLFNYFNELSEPEYTYKKPNRRYDDPILRGLLPDHNGLDHIIHYQDISGSITDDQIIRFNSELKFIKDEFKPERLTVVTFDTHIRQVFEFYEDDEFSKITVQGRGGTNLFPVMTHMKKHQPNAAVIFTDLEVTIPAEKPTTPIIWVCVENSQKTVPYGRLIHFSENRGYRYGQTRTDNLITLIKQQFGNNMAGPLLIMGILFLITPGVSFMIYIWKSEDTDDDTDLDQALQIWWMQQSLQKMMMWRSLIIFGLSLIAIAPFAHLLKL